MPLKSRRMLGEYDRSQESRVLLGHLARACGLSATDVARVETAVASTGARPDQAILSLGLAPETEVARALAETLDLPFAATADALLIDPDEAGHFDTAFRTRKRFYPLHRDQGRLQVAVCDPLDKDLLRNLAFHAGLDVAPIVVPEQVLTGLEARADRPVDPEQAVSAQIGARDAEILRDRASEGPVVELVDRLLTQAVERGASDIHLDATATGLRVRFRQHGTLAITHHETGLDATAIQSRVKVLAGLNVSERRRPQDGRIGRVIRGREVDFRVSTLPTRHGESTVIRVLDRNRQVLDLGALGFAPDTLGKLHELLDRPHGLFLVTGPTGSGKTTTLYAALSHLNSPARKICSIEDPVEFDLDGVSQTQVAPAQGLDFPTSLRAILRQDPNIVMIGEIRDAETAAIACRAALIGRLVLSTLHVNDPSEAPIRLKDLGVESYIIDAVLLGALGQTLRPVICGVCDGRGCAGCGGAGVTGREMHTKFVML